MIGGLGQQGSDAGAEGKIRHLAEMPAAQRASRRMGDNGCMTTKIDRIRGALEAFEPVHLEVLDESHMHSRGLETHYKAVIASDVFSGKLRVRRHQAVYAALGPLMQEIHALALHTYTPDEWAARGAAPDSPRCRGGSRHDDAPGAA